MRNIPKAEHVGIDEDESIEVGEGEAPHFEVDTLAVMLALVLVLVELLKELVGDLEVYGEEGVFIGLVIAATGGIVIGLGRAPIHWIAGVFLFMFTLALTNSSNQAIWQSKVPPEYQGRVFATRAFIATMGIPLSQLIAGPLTDLWAEPLMEDPPGALAALFGSGTGAGMGMIIFFTGVFGVIVGLAGYAFPNVRYVEERMPDHEKAAADEAEEKEEAGRKPESETPDGREAEPGPET